MTPGDRIKQAATVMAQVTVDAVLYHRYDIDSGAAASGMRTFRDGLGFPAVADWAIAQCRMVPVLIENGISWITATGIVRRDAVGVGVMDLLVRADVADLYGSSAGTPPSGFTFPSAVTTVSNAVTISVADSVAFSAAIKTAKIPKTYGINNPSLWSNILDGMPATFARSVGMPVSSIPTTKTGLIAVGESAEAHGADAIAIGKSTHARGKSSIAIGASVNATLPNSASIGFKMEAYNPNSFAHGIGISGIIVGATNHYVTQVVEHIQMQSKTTNATPTTLFCYENDDVAYTNTPYPDSEKLYMDAGVNCFDCLITAWNNATNEMKVWEYKFYTKVTNASADGVAFGTAVKTVVNADPNTASWDVSFTIDQPNDVLSIFCTGEAAKNILWVATVKNTRHTSYF